jgi:CRISPR-associated protein Csd1
MLHRVREYVERAHIPAEPGFSTRWARFAIVCDAAGNFEKVVELGDASVKNNPGRGFECAPEYTFSEIKFPGKFGHRAHFLLESAATVLMYGDDEPSPKTKNKHGHFGTLIHEAAKATQSVALQAVDSVLGNSSAVKQIRAELSSLKARPTDNVTFRVGNRFPVEGSDWHDWWRRHRDALQREMALKRKHSVAPLMRCFLTGHEVVPARTLGKLTKIDRRAGGSPMGNVLVGFDKEAFCSYGLEQSFNAAMSEEAGKTLESGLNHLLRHLESSHQLAGARVVHWFKQNVPVADDILSFLFDPVRQELSAQQRARELLDAIRTGKRADLGDNEYYVLLLSGSGGRVMVRGWQEGRFEELASAVAQWFSDLAITNLSGAKLANDPGIEAVVTCFLPEKKPGQDWSDWVKPVTALRQALWEAALRRLPMPPEALARIITLLRAFCLSREMDDLLGGRITGNRAAQLTRTLYCRMALIRAYHLRKRRGNLMNHEQPYLNPDHPNAAYHCGRLMAVLADLQRAALGDVSANVIQRYYAAASTTPGLVLGRLVRNAQFHKDKLEPGLAHWYDQRLADIHTRLGDRPPTTLSLEEQSLFALGYYQQIAKNNADRRAAKAQKSSAVAAEEKTQ